MVKPVINLDEGDDGDWIKARSWDLPVNPDYYITRYQDVQAWLDHMDRLPAGNAMPSELRQALEAFIAKSDTGSTLRSEGATMLRPADDAKSVFDAYARIEARVAALEIKSVVRHVRTDAGVRKFNQPIGAVIVADGNGKGAALLDLWSIHDKPDSDGFRSYSGSDSTVRPGAKKATPTVYRVGKKGRSWVAEDVDGNPIVGDDGKQLRDADEGNLLRKVSDHSRAIAEKQAKRVGPEQGKRTPPKGMHRGTGDEIIAANKQRIKMVDIFFFDDWKSNKSRPTVGYGYNRDGRQVSFRREQHIEDSAKEKFETVRSMEPKMAKFTAMCRKDWRKDDAIAATYLMRMYGLRVGTYKPDGSTANDAFGVTQLQAKHVKVDSKGHVTLEIPSKKGSVARIDVTDPTAKAILKEKVKGKKPTDDLFDLGAPSTRSKKTAAVIKKHFGPDVVNHNLRHYRATEEATSVVEAWIADGYELPQTYEEFRDEWAIPLGEHVDETILFDKKQAWKSYIDPTVLEPIVGRHEDWLVNFMVTQTDKGV